MSTITAATTAATRAPGTRAAVYVVVLVWVLPLAGFTVAAAAADATPCETVDGFACNAQDSVVLTGAMSAVLLLPLGLVALVVVALLARSGWRPLAVAAAAVASAGAVGALVVGAGMLVG